MWLRSPPVPPALPGSLCGLQGERRGPYSASSVHGPSPGGATSRHFRGVLTHSFLHFLVCGCLDTPWGYSGARGTASRSPPRPEGEVAGNLGANGHQACSWTEPSALKAPKGWPENHPVILTPSRGGSVGLGGPLLRRACWRGECQGAHSVPR